LAELVTQERANEQIASMGHASVAIEDALRAVLSASAHDRLDLLAQAVDHHGRVRRAAAAGLATWREAATRGDGERIATITRDLGRQDFSRALLAGAWALHPSTRKDAVRTAIERAEGKPDPGYSALAAALLIQAGEPPPTWMSPASTPIVLPAESSSSDLSAQGVQWVIHESGTLDIVLQQLTARGPQRAGRPIRHILGALSERTLPTAATARLIAFVKALKGIPLEASAVQDAFRGWTPTLSQAIAHHMSHVVQTWGALFARDTSDYRGQRSSGSYHACALAIALGEVRYLEFALDLIEGTEEAHLRPRALADVSSALAVLVGQGLRAETIFELLTRMVAIEVDGITPVTADYLLFGLGRALSRRGDAEGVATAFKKIRHPWIHGQLLACLPEDPQVARKVLPLVDEVEWPLARLFGLQGIFRSLSTGGTAAELEHGIAVALALEDMEMIVSGLESVLADWRRRPDGRQLRDALAARADVRAALEGSFLNRLDVLFDEAPAPQSAPSIDYTTQLSVGVLPELADFSAEDWAMLVFDWLLSHPPEANVLRLVAPMVAQAPRTPASVAVLLACVEVGVHADWGEPLAPLAAIGAGGRGWDAIANTLDDDIQYEVVRWMSRGERGSVLASRLSEPIIARQLPSIRDDIGASDFGRSYPVLRNASRPLLMALVRRFATQVRVTWLICAELLGRDAAETEIDALRDAWLREPLQA
jgi:hypothetical protein